MRVVGSGKGCLLSKVQLQQGFQVGQSSRPLIPE